MVYDVASQLHNILGRSGETVPPVLLLWYRRDETDRFDQFEQRNDESVTAFIQRFRDVKNRCFSLVLSDQQLAEVAFQGLLPHIREKYASQEFYSISQMVHRITGEARPYEQKRSNFQKKVNFVDCSDSSDSDDDQMVGLAEWVQNNKKPISCPFGNKEPEKYGFNITKAQCNIS